MAVGLIEYFVSLQYHRRLMSATFEEKGTGICPVGMGRPWLAQSSGTATPDSWPLSRRQRQCEHNAPHLATGAVEDTSVGRDSPFLYGGSGACVQDQRGHGQKCKWSGTLFGAGPLGFFSWGVAPLKDTSGRQKGIPQTSLAVVSLPSGPSSKLAFASSSSARTSASSACAWCSFSEVAL